LQQQQAAPRAPQVNGHVHGQPQQQLPQQQQQPPRPVAERFSADQERELEKE